MPVVIDQLSTSFQVRDEARIRRMVQKEITAALQKLKRGTDDKAGGGGVDPADPAAGGAPQAEGGS